jgi:DNA polymerase-3 subunit beta
MQLFCLQDNLAQGLSVAGRAVATRPTLPILSHVLLSTDQSQLKLAATDLELSVACWIGASVEREGSIAVPARLLTDLIRSWPPERVDLVVEQGTLRLACGTSEAAIKGIAAEQFPLIPKAPDEMYIEIDPRLLRRTVSQVVFAAATDDARPILAGVLARFEHDMLTMAAADGFRLSMRQVRLAQPVSRPMSVIIPARALNELTRISSDDDKSMDVHINPARSQILFRLVGDAEREGGHVFGIELASQLIEGSYIDYQRLIPKSYATRTIVDTQRLLNACKTASIFVRNETNDVYLDVEPGSRPGGGRVRLTAVSTDVGDSADDLPAQVDGNPITIGFNVRFLIDALSVMESAQIVLETTDATRFAVMRPLGSDDFLHILAPMVTRRLR